MQEIADDLNKRGVPTKRGRVWSKRQVFRVLHSPLYRGALHWTDIVTEGAHVAISLRTRRSERRRS